MVTLYPYTLWALATDPLTKSATGDAVKPNQVWQSQSVCRDEQNAAGQSVTLVDSTTITPSAVIYLPLSAPDLVAGTAIEVRKLEVVRLKGTVKRFSRDLMHCRLWV